MAYSVSQIEQAKLGSDDLSILHINIRSIRKNSDNLLAYLSQHSFRYDIIGVTETWLKESESAHIPGYEVISLPRCSSSRGGGVALFTRNGLGFRCCDVQKHSTKTIEALFVRFSCGLLMGVIYRPPSSCKNEFIAEMEAILLPFTIQNGPIVICGDFNIDLLGNDCSDYVFLLQSFNLRNVITTPTRISSQTASLIDHMLFNQDIALRAGVCDVAIADHCPIFLLLPRACMLPLYQRRPNEFVRVDYASVKSLLQCTDFAVLQNVDVNVEFQNFVTHIKQILTQCTHTYSKHNYEVPVCPWMTQEILGILKRKDSYYNKWKKNRSNKYYHDQFKYYRNKSVAMLRKSKKEYLTRLITRNKGDTRQQWNIVKDATGLNQERRVTPSSISPQVANEFNNFFINVGLNLAKKFPLLTPTGSVRMAVGCTFQFHVITIDEIKSVVSKMSVNKAAGHDSIQTRVLKENINTLCPHLCHLFNHSLENSCYPDILKIAKVVPIYKSGDQNTPCSYRPISVLSVINTLFEKLVAQQLKEFITENNIIVPQQHGFVSNKSTSTAVLSLSQHIYSAMHQDEIAVVLFLDIKKAFDTVCHTILLRKLEGYGFTNNVLKFFSSYLSFRKQYVVINDFISEVKYISCGVPQGSVLGPLLFSLYINDLPQALHFSETLMYADDTALTFTGKSLITLQNRIMVELSALSSWFSGNRLTLNVAKTKYVIFHSRQKTLDYSLISLSLDATLIEQVFSFKYLGVLFDNHLHWKDHVNNVCKKLAFGCYTLIKAKQYFPSSVLRSLYFSFCHSHISYCIESWGLTYVTYLSPLLRLQKRALRIISSSAFCLSSTNFFEELRILSFMSLRSYKICITINNIIQTNSPLPSSIFFFPNRDTRHAFNLNFNLPKCSNLYGERLIQFAGAKVWNELPIEIKVARDFDMSCKLYYLSNQTER